MRQRIIEKITKSPFHQGFLGAGHQASAVIDGSNFSVTDPFIVLMDDRLNLPGGKPVGGPHPHAGFETVTFVLQGNDKDWKTGTVELMTAGKGIIHTEEITAKTDMRILQLWLALPPEKRWATPFFQQILLEDVPALRQGNNEIRVYSGSSNGLTSPLQNHTPFTLVDFKMEKNATIIQVIPATYNAFIYVINGDVWVGKNNIQQDEAGWFDRSGTANESEMIFETKENEARFVLYAAEPHHVPIISHGPFIGDSHEDIKRLNQEYRQGKMPHLNNLPESRKIYHTSTQLI